MNRGRGFQALLVRVCVHRAGLVAALAALAALCAIRVLYGVDLEMWPRLATDLVEVRVRAPGLGPGQVETLATAPLERALQGLPGLRQTYSRSLPGLALLRLRFAPAGSSRAARRRVRERLAALRLPAPARRPWVGAPGPDRPLVATLGLTSSSLGPMRLRDVARRQLRPRLLAVAGVASVRLFGGRERALQVQVGARRLRRLHVGIDQVLRAARQAMAVPGIGCIETPEQRLLARADPPAGAGGLAQAVLRASPSRVLTLADVARVGFAPLPARSAARIGSVPGVELVVRAQAAASTLRVARGVEQALARLRPMLAGEGVVLHAPMPHPARLLRTALRELAWRLVLGALLGLGALRLLLGNWRGVALCACAGAATLLAASALLVAAGAELDLLRLAGVGLGVLAAAGDAVWLLQESRRAAPAAPASALAARRALVLAAARSRGYCAAATCAVLLAVSALLLVPGATAGLVAPLAWACATSLLVSLLVGATLTPALAALASAAPGAARGPARMPRGVEPRYLALRGMLARRWRLGALLAGLVVAAGAWAAAQGRFELLPRPREGPFMVRMRLASGSSLQASMRMGARVEAALRGLPQVGLVTQRAADAGLVPDDEGAADSRFDVALRAGADPVLGLRRVREVLAGFAGATFRVDGLFARRLGRLLDGGGDAAGDGGADLVVRLGGDRPDRLELAARRAAAVLRALPSATGVQLDAPPRLPQLRLRLRAAALRICGASAGAVLGQLRTAQAGGDAGSILLDARAVPVRVALRPAQREDPQALGALPIRTPRCGMIALRALARPRLGTVPARIDQVDGVRTLRVFASTTSADAQGFVRAASQALRSRLRLPPGISLRVRAPTLRAARRRRRLFAGVALAAAGVVLVLGWRLREPRRLGLGLAGLPVAWAGGILLSRVCGTPLSLGSAVGMLALAGVALRDAGALLGAAPAPAAARAGGIVEPGAAPGLARAGFAALPTVALALAIAALPLALAPGLAGCAVAGPMARMLLGGLAALLAYEAFVLPGLAQRPDGVSPPRRSTPTDSSR
jgi:multidrug efflux pump subunit AcrB